MTNTLDIEETLKNLGYNLQDRGEYWQCSAVYRNGDNPNALQIYKDSGVWKDYVQGESFLPFPALLEKTVGKENLKNFNLNLKGSLVKSKPKDLSTDSLEKTFLKSDFESLLPHYSFYNKKNISNDTLKFLNSGMCTSGSMYQRYVFPIFNKFGQIHGAAGRDMTNSSSRPKWKHMGKKTFWVYPFYCISENGDYPILNSIVESKEVILVESIGDMLSLFENGHKNVLVTFGLDVSPQLISILMGLNLNKIWLAFNNDFNKKNNAGRIACVKNFLKLLNYFSHEKINICLPVKNDFGDMDKQDYDYWEKKKEINNSSSDLICNTILKLSKQMFSQKKLSKNLFDNIKKLPCYDL